MKLGVKTWSTSFLVSACSVLSTVCSLQCLVCCDHLECLPRIVCFGGCSLRCRVCCVFSQVSPLWSMLCGLSLRCRVCCVSSRVSSFHAVSALGAILCGVVFAVYFLKCLFPGVLYPVSDCLFFSRGIEAAVYCLRVFTVVLCATHRLPLIVRNLSAAGSIEGVSSAVYCLL